jgi:hypothetical protein
MHGHVGHPTTEPLPEMLLAGGDRLQRLLFGVEERSAFRRRRFALVGR